MKVTKSYLSLLHQLTNKKQRKMKKNSVITTTPNPKITPEYLSRKGVILNRIISKLADAAKNAGKPFDKGDIWLSLVFNNLKDLEDLADKIQA